MNDPWQVLGVSRDATDEQVKSAYRKLAQKYHPDLNPGNAEAAAKMQEINAAYDQIKNPESYRAAQAQEQARRNAQSGGYGYAQQESPFGSGWNPFEGWGYSGWGYQQSGARQQSGTQYRSENDTRFRSAKSYLQSGQYDQAINILNTIPLSERNAEWYYLSATANYQVGNRITAQQQARCAVQMEPSNALYRNLLERMQRGSGIYQQQSSIHIPSIAKIFAGICAANLLMRLCLCCRF